MSKQDLIKERWAKDYKDKKIDTVTLATINSTITEWEEWVGKINDTVNPLQWFELDMKNCSNDQQPKPAKPEKKETDEEKKRIYREWQYKNKLATFINNKMRPKTLGSWLVDQAGFLCGGSVMFSSAFGVWTKYDVEASFENIKNTPKYKFNINKDYSEEDCKEFKELLNNIKDEDWLVRIPYKEDKAIEDEEKAIKVANDSISKLKKLIGANNIKELEKQEQDGFLSDGMRHKIMMLQSISNTNSSKDFFRKLLFKNEIGPNVIDWLKEGTEKLSGNWVTRSVWVVDKTCTLLGIEEQCDIPTIKNIGSLVWSLNLEEEFANIDDKNYKQIVYTGAPGTGKTYGITDYVKSACIKNPLDNETINKMKVSIDQYKFVQFHSSYDYSDFVEGLRPVQLQEGQNPTFVRMDGVFKKFCRNIVEYNNKYNELHEKEIKKDTHKKAEETTSFYFIIDEINRADLGKVFGELMYGLEESYRGKDHAFETQYMNLATYCENPSYVFGKDPDEDNKANDEDNKANNDKYIPIEEDVFAKGFYIPENLRIIGSMNDIDRSVETFDFALRRRFQWKEISANDEKKLNRVLESMFDKNDAPDAAYGNKDELVKRIIGMNEVISGEDHKAEINGSNFGFGEAYQIGPAYFKSFNGYFTKKDTPKGVNGCCLEIIWEEKIEPTLREYVRGRMPDQIDKFINECRDKLIVELKDDNATVNDSADANNEKPEL